MFLKCSRLTSGPSISGASLGYRCCYQMFSLCTSLRYPSSMSAGTMGEECCYQMYYGCTGMENASGRSISATTMGKKCCYQMFYQTGSYTNRQTTYVWSHNNITEIENGKVNLITGNGEVFPFHLEDLPYRRSFWLIVGVGDAFGFTVEISGASIIDEEGNAATVTCEGGKFHAFHFEETNTRSNEFVVSIPDSNCLKEYSGLEAAPSISVTNAGEQCFAEMFRECRNMTDAGSVDLSHLSEAPKLCCESMFRDCESLKTPPAMPECDVIAERAFQYMFYGCASECYVTTGISGYYGLEIAPSFSPVVLGDSCCEYMSYSCYNISSAGGIDFSRVESVGSSCCYSMFYNCKSGSVRTRSDNAGGEHTAWRKMFLQYVLRMREPSCRTGAAGACACEILLLWHVLVYGHRGCPVASCEIP